MRNGHSDYILFIIIIILIIYGLMMITSGGIVISLEKFKDPYYFFKKQIVNLLIGILLAYIAYKIPYRSWRRLALPLFVINLIFLGLVLAPSIGHGPGATKRWIDIGSISFQPSEFLKLSLIIYLAAIWSSKSRATEAVRNENEFLPFLTVMIIAGGLIIAEPDVGTFSITAAIATVMFFLSGAKMRYILFILLGGAGAFFTLIKTASYRTNRWISFLHPELDPQGIGYQINQALMAMGAGGLFGLGLGQSRQKYNFLPEPVTDSITAIIGEELGYIGLMTLIFLFFLFVWRGLIIYKKAPDAFGQLLASGIAALILVQTMIHFGAVSGFLPLTGVPLPFISYGGSALITNLIACGILLNISKNT